MLIVALTRQLTGKVKRVLKKLRERPRGESQQPLVLKNRKNAVSSFLIQPHECFAPEFLWEVGGKSFIVCLLYF